MPYKDITGLFFITLIAIMVFVSACDHAPTDPVPFSTNTLSTSSDTLIIGNDTLVKQHYYDFLTPSSTSLSLIFQMHDRTMSLRNADIIEIETPGKRKDGYPNTMFFDPKGEKLTYSVESTNPSSASVKLNAADGRFGGRPSVAVSTSTLSSAIGTQTSIVITARNQSGQQAKSFYRVTIVAQ